MGKKDKGTVPNPASIPNKDILQRLNFLYQASVYLTNLSQAVPPTAHVPTLEGTFTHAEHLPCTDQGTLSPGCSRKKNERRRRRQRMRTADELARAYIDTMMNVGKRATVKMYVFFRFCFSPFTLIWRRYTFAIVGIPRSNARCVKRAKVFWCPV